MFEELEGLVEGEVPVELAPPGEGEPAGAFVGAGEPTPPLIFFSFSGFLTFLIAMADSNNY